MTIDGRAVSRHLLLPAIVFLMESAARVLMVEKSLGMSTGHTETIAFIHKYLDQLDANSAQHRSKARSPSG